VRDGVQAWWCGDRCDTPLFEEELWPAPVIQVGKGLSVGWSNTLFTIHGAIPGSLWPAAHDRAAFESHTPSFRL